MFKIKNMALLLVSALLLCSCAGESKKSEVMLFEGNDVAEEEKKIETTTVRKGVYKETVSAPGEIEYLEVNDVTLDEENAYLDKVCVKHGDKVKKGDVIAYYHIESSESSLKKKKLLSTQARSQYDVNLRAKRSQVLEKEKAIKYLKSETEKRIARIELKKLKKEYEQLINSETEILKQEKEYKALLRKQKKTPLKASFSGTIVHPVSAKENDGVEMTGESIMKIRNDEEYLIKVTETDVNLRYNMKVDIKLGSTSEDIKHKLTGRVISTSNLTGGESNEAAQYIKVSKADMKKYPIKKYNIYITGVVLRIEDAILVDSTAVGSEAGETTDKLFVQLVEDGKLHKRYIVSNYKQDDYYLVNQGLEEGQTVAILDN